MNKVRITKKLRLAVDVLSAERLADCAPEAFIIALQTGKIKPQAIYKTMSAMKYTWSAARGFWTWKPRHLKSVKRIFAIVNKIDDALIAEMMND